MATSWAAAQQTIQFSKPVDSDLGKANSFLNPSASPLSPGAFNAPTPLFGDRTPSASFDILPGGPVPITTANSQWQKAFNARKNWSLMTPEEILNLPTPEKMFGVPDAQDDSKLSPEERFLQRRQQQDNAVASNRLAHTEGFFQDPDSIRSSQFGDPNRSFGSPSDQQLDRSAADLTGKPSSIFDEWNASSRTTADQSAASSWSSPFGQPLPKPTPEALAGMDRFRALMDGTVAEKSPTPTQISYQPYSSPATSQPLVPATVGRIGHSSFSALEDSSSRPVGLTPLPGLDTPRPTTPKTTSLVQPPPWMNQSPQSFNLPQRQF